jgi:hypothetical protein
MLGPCQIDVQDSNGLEFYEDDDDGHEPVLDWLSAIF